MKSVVTIYLIRLMLHGICV